MPEPQTYATHVKRMPASDYLFVVPFLANVVLAAYRLGDGITVDRIVNLGVAIGLIALLFSARRQVVTVQDRVIRNEMRERMQKVLPPDLCERASHLPVRQMVALRFASDAELPGLVQEVLDGRLTAPKEIKMRVRDWQADHLRC